MTTSGRSWAFERVNNLESKISGLPPGQAQYLVVLPPQDDMVSINMGSLLKLLWQRGWMILLSALIAGAAVAFYVINKPNIYRASAVVAVRSGDEGIGQSLARGQLGGLASLAGVNIGSGGGERSELVAGLTSRSLAEQFIREQKITPYLFWDKRTREGNWKGPAPTMGEAVDRWLEDVLLVNEDRKTGLVSISVEHVDRALAARLANAYVAIANRTTRARQIREANGTIAYLNQQLAVNRLEGVREALYRLMETNFNRIAIANVRPDYPFAFVDRAVAPEPKKKVRPKRSLMVIFGALGGGTLAALVVMLMGRNRFLQRPAGAGRLEMTEDNQGKQTSG
jgi:uncharacterized protein involved in exopolysaccharide biosynthesis